MQDPRDACVAADRSAPCAPAAGIDGANRITVSRDGRSVYASGWRSSAIAAFSRTGR